MKILEKLKYKRSLLSIVISIPLLFVGCTSKTSKSKVLDSQISNHNSNVSQGLDVNSKDVIKATVDRVVDGDTVEIILPNNKEVDTRLLLIDTPETKHPSLGVQKYGPEASEFAKSLLKKGDTVYFELDGKTSTDKYGRYLGYLWYTCPEHKKLEMYNERTVEEGLARVGYIYNQTKHLDALNKTQNEAKSNKLNIWSIDGYVTDKGYDMSKINEKESSGTINSNDKNVVYANGGNSKSNYYHKSRTSHGMKGAIKLTEKEALDKGYGPCSKCFK